MVMKILNCHLAAAIQFRDTLHGFCMGRGTRTASLEAKLLQQLMSVKEEVIYNIFLILYKSYDALDHGLCLEILVAYRVGPQDLHVLWRHWECLNMVARACGYFRDPFKGQCVMTQGYLISTIIFNMLVYTVLWHWVAAVEETEGGEEPRTEGFGQDIQQMVTFLC